MSIEHVFFEVFESTAEWHRCCPLCWVRNLARSKGLAWNLAQHNNGQGLGHFH
jgi:hypothetical protein